MRLQIPRKLPDTWDIVSKVYSILRKRLTYEHTKASILIPMRQGRILAALEVKRRLSYEIEREQWLLMMVAASRNRAADLRVTLLETISGLNE